MKRIYYLLDFLVFYIWDLILGALKIALDVITRKNMSSPGIIKFPLEANKDFEIALLSNLITFSPGSMVIDIEPDRSYLYIHIMFLEDKEEAKKVFKEEFEARVLRILR